MKDFISSITKEKTENVNASTSTDLADSIDLLSSGIYTEEERFIFELIQNAVDAFEDEFGERLRIRIAVQNDYIVFMHNGAPFSKRDIKGLCSVGNGNKKDNVKKIGYKGIGFKSVFMHSQEVTILSNDIAFRFDKNHWSNFEFNGKSEDEFGRKYRLPWQIIPIVSEEKPISIDTEGFNVITFIKSENIKSIGTKVERMLSNSNFLLFLGQNSISIEYIDNGNVIKTLNKEITTSKKLGDHEQEREICLSKDNNIESKWLVYQNDCVSISNEHKSLICTDPKIPEKLRISESFDISFAIQLENNDSIKELSNTVLYTYLPTSYQFGLPFILNANFITDAGRQQINTDSIWNQMIASAFPAILFKWISTFSKEREDYYKAMPVKRASTDPVSCSYNEALKNAINNIPFVPNKIGNKLLCSVECVYDQYKLFEALNTDRFSSCIKQILGANFNLNNIVDFSASQLSEDYKVKFISKTSILTLIEHSKEVLDALTVDENIQLIRWIRRTDIFESNDASIFLANQCIILDNDGVLSKPLELFFPSKYKDENSMAADARIMSETLFSTLTEEDKQWLSQIGVSTMSNISVIKNVLCKQDYITTTNAVDVIRFIFDTFGTRDFINHYSWIPNNDLLSSTEISNLKLLAADGNLYHPTELLIGNEYGTSIRFPDCVGNRFLISKEYLRNNDEPTEWMLLFKRLGAQSSIELSELVFKRGSYLFKSLSRYTEFARRNEYNHSSYTGGNYYMCPSETHVKFTPLISIEHPELQLHKYVWSILFTNDTELTRDDDFIFGSTGYGYTKKGYLCDDNPDHRYLGENFLPWSLKNYNLLPGSDGKLHKIQHLLENTDFNKELCGAYFPVLDIDKPIHNSWKRYIAFKEKLSLSECLTILSKISQSTDTESISDNKARISRLYDYIASEYCQSITDQDQETLSSWGAENKLLSREGIFYSPSKLVLVSEDLGSKVDISRQVFQGKYIGRRNEGFVNFIRAIGVKFIDKYTPKFEDTANKPVLDNEFKESLIKKAPYIAMLSAGKETDMASFETTIRLINERINNISFIEHDGIYLDYGGNLIKRPTLVINDDFHHCGKINLAIKEMLLPDLADKLGIKTDETVLFAILQMNNNVEIREFLELKEYPVELIPNEPVNTPNQGDIIIGGTSENGLDEEARKESSIEAKNIVKEFLERNGYKFTKGIGEYSIIPGVIREGINYPLVVKNHRSNHHLNFNPAELEELKKDRSMLWIHFGNRVIKSVNIGELLSRQDKLTLTFSTENLADDERLWNFAHSLRFFKNMHFDIESLSQEMVSDKLGNYDFNKRTNEPIQLSDEDNDDNL